MKWTEKKDIMLLTTMAGEGVFQWKHGSRERGSAWDVVAESLNCQKEFSVNQRSIRDRFNTLARKVKAKLAKEERASGGGEVLQSESDKLVEELITLGDESEKKSEDQREAKREVVANEKKKALEMTDRALETMGETRNRNEEERRGQKKRDSCKKRGDQEETCWMAEGKGRVGFRNKEAGDKREERRKSSSRSYRARTTATAAANSARFAATTAVSATAAAATTTRICLAAKANDGYIAATTKTNAGSAVFSS